MGHARAGISLNEDAERPSNDNSYWCSNKPDTGLKGG